MKDSCDWTAIRTVNTQKKGLDCGVRRRDTRLGSWKILERGATKPFYREHMRPLAKKTVAECSWSRQVQRRTLEPSESRHTCVDGTRRIKKSRFLMDHVRLACGCVLMSDMGWLCEKKSFNAKHQEQRSVSYVFSVEPGAVTGTKDAFRFSRREAGMIQGPVRMGRVPRRTPGRLYPGVPKFSH